MTIQEYFGEWSKVIDLKEADRIMRHLIVSKIPVCPLPENIFRAFQLCSFSNLRVVIVGQDPYPTLKISPVSREGILTKLPVATGLAFANSSDTLESQLSPSLKVLRESVIDYTVPHRIITFDPSLEKWEKQGVLLLNTALSCTVGKPDSHNLLWRPFINSLLRNLSQYHSALVYVLMGTAAQSFETCINKQYNHILYTMHPAWYFQQKQRMPSLIWKQVDNILTAQYGQSIEWYEEY